jgi:hypothetical protein
VPATLVQTANAGACSVDNRFDMTIPQVEVTDSAGNKYTFSGVQHLHQYYYRGGGGRGGGGAGCHSCPPPVSEYPQRGKMQKCVDTKLAVVFHTIE